MYKLPMGYMLSWRECWPPRPILIHIHTFGSARGVDMFTGVFSLRLHYTCLFTYQRCRMFMWRRFLYVKQHWKFHRVVRNWQSFNVASLIKIWITDTFCSVNRRRGMSGTSWTYWRPTQSCNRVDTTRLAEITYIKSTVCEYGSKMCTSCQKITSCLECTSCRECTSCQGCTSCLGFTSYQGCISSRLYKLPGVYKLPMEYKLPRLYKLHGVYKLPIEYKLPRLHKLPGVYKLHWVYKLPGV